MTKPKKAKAIGAAARKGTLAEQVAKRSTGKWQQVAGTVSDDFNHMLLLQAIGTTWLPKGSADPEAMDRNLYGVSAAMIDLAPTSAIEGMAAAQLVALHNAAMECARRAMIPEQTADGCKLNLDGANKCSRTFAVLLDSLNKHRGKGQQTVRVEHVHVDARQQTVNVHPPGGGGSVRGEEQSHATDHTGYEPSAALRGSDALGGALRLASGGGPEALPDAWRDQSGGTSGEPERAQVRSLDGRG